MILCPLIPLTCASTDKEQRAGTALLITQPWCCKQHQQQLHKVQQKLRKCISKDNMLSGYCIWVRQRVKAQKNLEHITDEQLAAQVC